MGTSILESHPSCPPIEHPLALEIPYFLALNA